MLWISAKNLYMLMHVCLLNISHNSWQDEMEIGRSSSVVSNRLPNHLYVKIVNKTSPLYLHDLITIKQSKYSFRYQNTTSIQNVPSTRTTRYSIFMYLVCMHVCCFCYMYSRFEKLCRACVLCML